MNAHEIIAKADRGEGLTVEEIKIYQQAVKPVKQVYGKYGTLKLKYLEEKGVDWTIANLPEYLHGVDKQADELYKTMYAKLSQDENAGGFFPFLCYQSGNSADEIRASNYDNCYND